jgi:CPA2 family monovalent cation:H+ antiporter-2
MAAGVVAARARGLDRDAAVNVGLTLLSRGEFALVLGSLAAAAGLDGRLAPFVAGYVLLLAILGPLAATHSRRLAPLVPRELVGEPA